MRERAERLADAANLQGAKVTADDLLPKPQSKPGQLGPEVFQKFAEAFEVDGKTT
jgi:hypothetical protein